MMEIRPILPDEWIAAKQIIYRVSHILFEDPRSLEEAIAYKESLGRLKDMDDIQKNYFQNGGVFLVVTDNNQVVGMGGIRRLEDKICELKRIVLLFEYQGKGLGYRLVTELLQLAREMGYEKIRLETAPAYQKRASVLYKRLGFYEIPKYGITHPDDIAMEMIL
jgi:putative acetyltransferase